MGTGGHNRGWFALSIGMGIPLGDYAKTDLFNANSGFAKLGFAANLDYAVPFNPNVGAIFSVNGFINQCDEEAIKNFLKLFGGMDPSLSMTAWKAGSLLGGFYVRSNAAEGKASFYGKIQLGYALTQSYELSLRIDDPSPFSTDYVSSHQSSGTAGAFVINGGAGILIPLPSGPSFTIGVNYITMKSEFENIELKTEEKSGSAPVQTTTNTVEFPMTLSNMQVHAGLAWSLY